MEATSNLEIKAEMQAELLCINELVMKIKQELQEMNHIVSKDGRLDQAITNANYSLSKIARDLGIVVQMPMELEKDATLNSLDHIKSSTVTEKMMSFIVD